MYQKRISQVASICLPFLLSLMDLLSWTCVRMETGRIWEGWKYVVCTQLWYVLYANVALYKTKRDPHDSTMVFCYQNCSDLLWEKSQGSRDREKLLKFKAEGREFANFLRSLEQFFGTMKVQNNFWNRMLFKLIPWGFSDILRY